MAKSSSSIEVFTSSATRSFSDRPPLPLFTASSTSTRRSMMARSLVTVSTMPGRCTFTATASPLGRMARCTCAMEAEPSGVSSNSANSSSMGLPSSVSTCDFTSAKSRGRACVRSSPSATQYSMGSTSGWVEAIWPSLTNVVPRSWMSSTVISGVRPSFRSYFLTMERISLNRACDSAFSSFVFLRAFFMKRLKSATVPCLLMSRFASACATSGVWLFGTHGSFIRSWEL